MIEFKIMGSCPICNTRNWIHELKAVNPDLNDDFNIVRCQNCGLLKTEIEKGKDLSTYYQSDIYAAKKKSVFNKVKGIFSIFLKYKLLDRYIKSGVLLDIGSGDGSIIKIFASKGWKVFGVDPTSEKDSSAENINVVNKRFEDVKLPENKFDVISFWHSFEHLAGPKEILDKCFKLINNKGLLFMSIPNSGSLGFRIFKNDWFALYPPVHIYHYNISNLTRLLEHSGFSVFRIDRFSLEYSPFVLLQSMENRLHIVPKNYLYKLSRGHNRADVSVFLISLLTIMLVPLLFVLTILEMLDSQGSGVINIYARPTKS